MDRVVLIGAGKVGTHLGRRLRECGVRIEQVYSRRLERARELARRIGARAVNQWTEVQRDADLYILAVNDQAISEAAAALQRQITNDPLVVHTSGATPSNVLKGFPRHGIFYPLQTFSHDREVDFSTIPICISAHRLEDEAELEQLARTISRKVYRIDDRQRAVLHVAAVFANNFANHCFRISHDILEKEQLPFEILEPLILETAQKVIGRHPADMQTGPAVRGDLATIQWHVHYLEQTNSPYQEIYRLLSQSILEHNDQFNK